MNFCYMSVTVLGSGDSAVNKIDKQPAVIEQEGGSRRGVGAVGRGRRGPVK